MYVCIYVYIYTYTHIYIYTHAHTPHDNGRECNMWNTLCTTKLKEVVASVRIAFKWQSTKERNVGKQTMNGSPEMKWACCGHNITVHPGFHNLNTVRRG